MSGIVGDNLFRASGVIASSATEYDDDGIQSDIAMLGFYVAVNGSLVRYNLVDQSIDEYYDTSGVDASASTNEQRVASGSNFYYDGGSTVVPTVTEDADSTGTDGLYSWYKWTATGAGSYNNDTTQDHEYLVIAGGGGAGRNYGGGGGAGGYLAATGLSLTGGNAYVPVVGGGGAGSGSGQGTSGTDSTLTGTGITTLTATGGGGSGNSEGGDGLDGGSGGGGGGTNGGALGAVGSGNTPSTTPSQGYDGGTGGDSNQPSGGGGGGIVAVGGNATGGSPTSLGGSGGTGIDNDITGSTVGYAGGGGGGSGLGGTGGVATHGGASGTNNYVDGVNATVNTGGGGGGGGGGRPGGNGATGIVVLRRSTNVTTTGLDMTLQSTDVTAEAEPTYGEIVTLIENAYGTATLNTDIKGYVSCDSGVTFAQGTLVNEGSWGTNKQILAFHDLDISSQTGTSMCYKITTHNQSAASLETRIYATSIGWR